MGLNFLIGILLARIIRAEGYGVFTYAFTLLSVICTIVVFGMDDLLVRDISSLQLKNDFAGIRSLLKWSIIRVLIFSAFISSLLLIVINYTDIVAPQKQGLFNALLTGIPVYTSIMILQAVQRGLHKVIQSQLPEKIIRSAMFLALVAGIYLLNANLITSFSVICMNIIAYVAALLLLIMQVKNNLGEYPGHIKIPSLWSSKESKSSFYFFIATIMAVINVRADILMLGWLKSDIEVGIYNVAGRFSDFTAFSLLIITPIIAPSIARLFSQNEKVKLQQLVTKAAITNFIFSLFVTLLLVLLGNFPLKIFGNEFTAGYFAMLILCGGQLLTTLAGPAGNILLMTGYEKLAFYAGLTGTIINIALNFLLIPEYGINGAAIATAGSMVVWNGIQTFYVFRKLKINPSVLSSELLNFRKIK